MKTLAFALAFGSALSASAALKIGTVNMMELVRLHPSHESNKAVVKSSDKEYKAKLAKKQEAVKAIMEEARKIQGDLESPMLTPAAKAAAKKKMDDVQQNFIAARQDLDASARQFQEKLSDLENSLLKYETEDLRAKINTFAKANGYDIIADSTMLAFSKDSLDVTDEILKALKVDPAKRAELKKEKNQPKANAK